MLRKYDENVAKRLSSRFLVSRMTESLCETILWHEQQSSAAARTVASTNAETDIGGTMHEQSVMLVWHEHTMQYCVASHAYHARFDLDRIHVNTRSSCDSAMFSCIDCW